MTVHSFVKHLIRSLGMLALFGWGNCEARTPAVYADRSNAANLVVDQDYDALAKALAAGSDPNGKDYRGEPALLLAANTAQWKAVNLLMDYGADIWFADELGFTAAGFAGMETRMSLTGDVNEERKAQQVFIDCLKQANYPWPPPNPVQMQALLQAGQWPPANAIRPAPVKFPAK